MLVVGPTSGIPLSCYCLVMTNLPQSGARVCWLYEFCLIAIWGNLVTIWCQKIWGEFCCLCAVGGCSAGCLFIAVIALIVVEHAGSVIVVVTVVCYGGGKQVETVS